MNPASILALLVNFYEQLVMAQRDNETLKKENEELKNQVNNSSTS